MDTNMMKQICELIQGMGADGKEAFIIWVCASNGLELLCTIIACYALYKGLAAIVNAVYESSKDAALVKELRMLLKVGTPGDIIQPERNEIAKKVGELLDRQGEAKQG